ncbi:hypothetical protein SISSUDRAFT_1065236 [Sistotremastrum suecicum HHB10207 ss-3]|uniref:Uncharacterized protein n=1 Tax=Sistotremastrum suecicum HHB10207 ss-3 TaxID=1314776 RepID=A0A165ZR59_9AGAM|nr:hypothetical protein SISSUDRAFT_1065236 [Sistotremastrum suecicum HHB10207 ss-3]
MLRNHIDENNLSLSQAAGHQAATRADMKDLPYGIPMPRPWGQLTASEKQKVIDEAMTHIRNNQLYGERYAATCVVTFVASVVPIEVGEGVADYVHSKENSNLQLATILPTLSTDDDPTENPHILRMERTFRQFARQWYANLDVEVQGEGSDSDAQSVADSEQADGEADGEIDQVAINELRLAWRARRLALIQQGLGEQVTD